MGFTTEQAADVAVENVRLRARVEYLERVIAYEARVIEAQALDVKALGKGRKRILTESVDAMRHVIREEPTNRYSDVFSYSELDLVRRG